MLSEELLTQYHEAYPREAIGVIFEDGTTFPLRNWSRKPRKFITPAFDLWRHYGFDTWFRGTGITHIYHSHAKIPRPSKSDQRFMAVLAVRWPHVKHLIYCPDGSYAVWQYGDT